MMRLLIGTILGLALSLTGGGLASADSGWDSGDGWLGDSATDDNAYWYDANWWEVQQLEPIGPCDENGCY